MNFQPIRIEHHINIVAYYCWDFYLSPLFFLWRTFCVKSTVFPEGNEKKQMMSVVSYVSYEIPDRWSMWMERLLSQNPETVTPCTWSSRGTTRPSGQWSQPWWMPASPTPSLPPTPNPPSHPHPLVLCLLLSQPMRVQFDGHCQPRTSPSWSGLQQWKSSATGWRWAWGGLELWRQSLCTPSPNSRPPSVWVPRGGRQRRGHLASARGWSSAVSILKRNCSCKLLDCQEYQ